MNKKIARRIVKTGIAIASENASGVGESSQEIIQSSEDDLKGWGFIEKCLSTKEELAIEINDLKSQISKKDEIIKMLNTFAVHTGLCDLYFFKGRKCSCGYERTLSKIKELENASN